MGWGVMRLLMCSWEAWEDMEFEMKHKSQQRAF